MFRKILQYIEGLLFPPRCVGCGKEDTMWCTACKQSCIPYPIEIETRNGVIKKIYTGYIYEEGMLAKAIEGFKYHFARELAYPLFARTMMLVQSSDIPRDATVCPVPLHRRRYNWRGFNQSEILAEALARATGLPHARILVRTRYTAPQARMSKEERIRNMSHAFVFEGKHVPETVILVDDVMGSGATLEECARTLKRAGVQHIYAAVIARNIR